MAFLEFGRHAKVRDSSSKASFRLNLGGKWSSSLIDSVKAHDSLIWSML